MHVNISPFSMHYKYTSTRMLAFTLETEDQKEEGVSANISIQGTVKSYGSSNVTVTSQQIPVNSSIITFTFMAFGRHPYSGRQTSGKYKTSDSYTATKKHC